MALNKINRIKTEIQQTITAIIFSSHIGIREALANDLLSSRVHDHINVSGITSHQDRY